MKNIIYTILITQTCLAGSIVVNPKDTSGIESDISTLQSDMTAVEATANGSLQRAGGEMTGSFTNKLQDNLVQALGTVPSAVTWTVTNNFATMTITGATALTISGEPDGLMAMEVYANGNTNLTAGGSSWFSNSERFFLVDSVTNVVQFLTFGGRTYATVENF